MIPTAKELQRGWNAAAKNYARTLEKANLQLGFSLARMMNINSAKNILEVGCGSGLLTFNLLPSLPNGVRYTSMDISDEMIKLAQEKMDAMKNQFSHVDHKFLQGDAEDLSFVPNETIDAYLSSLCLHLVTDPNRALKEAMRVSKKGGKIAFSVLGRSEKCTFTKIFHDRLKEFNIEIPEFRDVYYLGSKERAVKLAKDNGIKVDYCWIEDIAMGVCEEDDIQMIIDLPLNRKIVKGLEEETRARFIKAMKDDFRSRKQRYEPLVTENILLVGTKE